MIEFNEINEGDTLEFRGTVVSVDRGYGENHAGATGFVGVKLPVSGEVVWLLPNDAFGVIKPQKEEVDATGGA